MSLVVQPWSPIHKKNLTKNSLQRTIKKISRKEIKKRRHEHETSTNRHIQKNNRWRVTLGNSTLITDTTKFKTLITTSKNMFWASGFLWPLSRRSLDATMTVTQNTQTLPQGTFLPWSATYDITRTLVTNKQNKNTAMLCAECTSLMQMREINCTKILRSSLTCDHRSLTDTFTCYRFEI